MDRQDLGNRGKWSIYFHKNHLVHNTSIFLFFLAISLVAYGREYFQGFQLALVSGDGVKAYANMAYLKESLGNGEFPLWTKYFEIGMPYTNLYPLNYLVAFMPMEIFVSLYYPLHLALGATFYYLYLRELNCSWKTSLITAIIFEFAVFVGGYRKEHIGIVIGIVYFPVLLYYIQKYLNSSHLKYLIVSSFVMALQFFGAHTQTVLYADIACFAYLLVWGIHKKIPFGKMMRHGTAWLLSYAGFAALHLASTLSLLMFNINGGAESVKSMGVIKSWSVHFAKLLMVLFPRIFNGDIFQFPNTSYSSELDIELFLGVILFSVVCFGIIRQRRQFETKVYLAFILVSFTYSALAHVPYLAEIVLRIPILNGFRVPSRALFICIIFTFTLFARSCDKTLSSPLILNDYGHFYLKFCFGITAVVILAGFTYMVGSLVNSSLSEDFSTAVAYFNNSFSGTLFVLFAGACIIALITWLINTGKISLRVGMNLFLLFVLGTTLFEVFPYSQMTYKSTFSGNFVATDYQSQVLKDIANYKVWDAQTAALRTDKDFFNHYYNSDLWTPSLNAETPYNNLYLYKLLNAGKVGDLNHTGMFVAMPDAATIPSMRNHVLSMLGIKYIRDTNGILHYESSADEAVTQQIIESNVALTGDGENVTSWATPIQIEPNTDYKVFIDAANDTIIAPDLIYFDFFGINYDYVDAPFDLNMAKGGLTLRVNSGDTSLAGVSPIYARLVALMDGEVTFEQVSVTKATYKSVDPYSLYYDDGNTRVYENPNAKDILYTTRAVRTLDSFEQLYADVQSYDLLNVSFLENAKDVNYSPADCLIDVTHYGANSITANTSCSEDTFLNFSQCYFPGWKAYIDGAYTEVHMVNGAIMGIELPAGEHTVTFRFLPAYFVIGSIISITTCIFWLVYFNRRKIAKWE